MTEQTINSFVVCNKDVLSVIFTHADPNDIFKYAQVCKEWNKTSKNIEATWKQKCHQNWPALKKIEEIAGTTNWKKAYLQYRKSNLEPHLRLNASQKEFMEMRLSGIDYADIIDSYSTWIKHLTDRILPGPSPLKSGLVRRTSDEDWKAIKPIIKYLIQSTWYETLIEEQDEDDKDIWKSYWKGSMLSLTGNIIHIESSFTLNKRYKDKSENTISIKIFSKKEESEQKQKNKKRKTQKNTDTSHNNNNNNSSQFQYIGDLLEDASFDTMYALYDLFGIRETAIDEKLLFRIMHRLCSWFCMELCKL